MKVSYNWLKEFVDIDVRPYDLANKLTLSGLEVESVFDIKEACFDSVVGKILSKEAIHNGLYLLGVDVSAKQYNIVTSDSRLEIGNKVGVAIAGSNFNNRQVKERKFGKYISEGFLLSASELGIEESSSNVLVLGSKFGVGNKLKEIEAFNDFIFDISITPNRADCLSVLGIAREVSIYYNKPLKIKECANIKEDNSFGVALDNKDCQSYIASNIMVNIAPSCFDIRLKLIKSGVRPINNVVDITNYCMLALGQPMHAFDKDKIGTRIIVRNAFKKERIVALNDNEYELEDDLVISDDKQAIAIAGIMGGKYSQIDENTKYIILESAYFAPDRIRKSSRRLKLNSESSYRFERGVDPNLNEYATYYAIELLQQHANAHVIGITKNISKKEPQEVTFNIDNVNEFLGSNYGKTKFYQLGFPIKETLTSLIAVIPTYRIDIESMEDIAEEIVRIDGYNKLPSTSPCVNLSFNPNKKDRQDAIREVLKLSGLNETINYSFVNSAILSKLNNANNILYLKNPLTQEQDCMRNTLFLGLMENLIFNLKHNIKSIAIFEIGKVFDADNEYNALGIMMYGFKPLNWYTKKTAFDFYDIKGSFENIFGLFDCNIVFKRQESWLTHPKKSLTIYNNDHYIGFLGEIHPDIYDIFDIKSLKANIFYGEMLIDSFDKPKSFSFKSLPKFPVVIRDLNIVVDKSEIVSDIKKTIDSFDFVYNVNLIDIYDMVDKKSLNFRIELYSPRRTLTDTDIENLINEIFSSLSSQFKASIRGVENGL